MIEDKQKKGPDTTKHPEPFKQDKDSELNGNEIIKALQREQQLNENLFPIEIFPEVIQDFINEIERTLSSNREYACSSVLLAFSTAFGNLYKIKIKEEYYQKANLWLVLVGRSGDGKSHIIDLAFKPLKKLESHIYKEYKQRLEEWNKITDNSDPKPVLKDYLLYDLTFEALCKAHKNNQHGLCITPDEILSWYNSLGKYSKSSSDLNNYLTMWNGNSFKVSRKTTGITYIPECFVNVIGGIQKNRFKEFSSGNEDSGFMDRFLFCYPDKFKVKILNRENFNMQVSQNYNTIFERIFEQYDETTSINVLNYDEDALIKGLDFVNNLNIKYDGDDDKMFPMGVKLTTYFHRLSLLIELITNISEDKNIRSVTLQSVEKAILLTEYFELNALKIRNSINDPFISLGTNEIKLYQKLPEQFKTSEANDLAGELKISQKSIERYIKKETLYTKLKHGTYKKKNI